MQEVLRNEKKYMLDRVEFLKVSHRIGQLLAEDPHNGPWGYMVRSLYFDTAYDSDYFDKEYGVEVRKKLRLRIYHTDDLSAFLEMKQKQGDQQKKRTLRIRRDDAERLAEGDYRPLLQYTDAFALECYCLMNSRCYRPRTIVQYQRKAFLAKENRIRITFDHDISATESRLSLFDPNLALNPVLPKGAAVMEVKYNGFLLSYIKQMLGGIESSQLSVSKYCMARQTSYEGHL